MFWKILLSVVLLISPSLQSAAQNFKSKSLGAAVSMGTDLSKPLTAQLELDITGTESFAELIRYLDKQDFAIQINYHLKRGGDPALMEKTVLQASITRLFTPADIDKLDAEVKRLVPTFDDRKARWRFSPSVRSS